MEARRLNRKTLAALIDHTELHVEAPTYKYSTKSESYLFDFPGIYISRVEPRLYPHRQFDNEFGPLGLVVLYPYISVMIRYDGIYNGEPQARSGFLRGEIGLEQP